MTVGQGAVAGSSAAPSPGASIYQLIGATQFMGLFGSMLDDTPVPSSSAPTTGRRHLLATNSKQPNDGQSFSSAFAWANLRFDGIFSLKKDTCAGKYMQGYFGVAGTFIAGLAAALMLRLCLLLGVSNIFQRVSGATPSKPPKGMGFGEHELHVVKTSHLGLCQITGILFAIAKYAYCPCGWLNKAAWAMAIMWLISIPAGVLVFMIWYIIKSKRNADIVFKPSETSCTWLEFLQKVMAAKGTAEDFCEPNVIYVLFKLLFGVIGVLFALLGLRGTMSGSYVECNGSGSCSCKGDDCAQTIAFWVLGAIFALLPQVLKTNLGRKFVIFNTNLVSASVGKKYVLNSTSGVVDEMKTGSTNCLTPLFTFLGDFSAKVKTMTDPRVQKCLRTRGKWEKKDNFSMFYEEYNEYGCYFACFLMLKNLFVGILLVTDPFPLVGPTAKAWCIFVLFLAEVGILFFLSPNIDAINGLKLAVQQLQQAIIMLIATLVVSGKADRDAGISAVITMSTMQVVLAMPEQIWGLIRSFVAPDAKAGLKEFPMTAAEIRAHKVSATGIVQKYHIAKSSVLDLKPIGSSLMSGKVEAVFTELFTNDKLLLKLNMLKPGCLNP
eukprot:752884-Hanusia_phi.AAC.2